MDVYGEGLYQTQQVFKYPKAGEANSTVSLHIHNLSTNETNEVKVDKGYNDFIFRVLNGPTIQIF